MFLLQYLRKVIFFFGSFYLAKISSKFYPHFSWTKVCLESPIDLSSVLGPFHILYLELASILFLGHFQILYLGPSYIKHSVSIICILTYFVIFSILPCFAFRAFLKLCSCTFSYLHNALWTQKCVSNFWNNRSVPENFHLENSVFQDLGDFYVSYHHFVCHRFT